MTPHHTLDRDDLGGDLGGRGSEGSTGHPTGHPSLLQGGDVVVLWMMWYPLIPPCSSSSPHIPPVEVVMTWWMM